MTPVTSWPQTSATPKGGLQSSRAAVPLGHGNARSARAPSTVGRKRTGEGARREATKWRDRDTVDLHSQRDMARPVRGGQPEENGGDGKRERVRRLPTLRLVNGGKLRGGVPGRRLQASRDGQPVPDGQSASGDAACAAGVPGRLEAPHAARRA